MGILSELKIGELMLSGDLTWQATLLLIFFFVFCALGVAFVLAKVIKAWKDALK